jgi:hypothetical protein
MILRLTALTALSVILFSGVSCDSHSWEETRVLHGHGKKHGEDEHGKEADHGKKADAHEAEAAKKDH